MKKILCLFLFSSTIAWAQHEYRVPVSQELERYATFAIVDSEVEIQAGILTLEYDLPKELVGHEKVTISLQGKSLPYPETLNLKGPKGNAICATALDKTLTCSITMRDLNIRPSSVKEVLQEISATPLELQARLKVAKIFRGEPAGIMIYRD